MLATPMNQLPDIFSLSDLTAIRAKVKVDIAGDKNSSMYSWCLPATITTDEAVAEFLEANPVENALDPLAYVVHLKDASDLLSNALSRLGDIQSLEEKSISTYLDYRLAEALQPGSLRLAKVSLKATRKQAAAGKDDANEDVLEFQDRAQTAAREMRLKLHSTSGNPLNYGERISYLRTLHAASMRLVIEKLNCARVGMFATGIAKCDAVPIWDRKHSGNLQSMVLWARTAIRKLDQSQARETTYYRTFSLELDGDMHYGTQVREILGQPLPGHPAPLTFELKPTHFEAGGTSRILKVGVAVAFLDDGIEMDAAASGTAEEKARFTLRDSWTREYRRSLLFSCEVRLPDVSLQLDTESPPILYSPKPLSLANQVPVWVDTAMTFHPDCSPHLENANPIGKWVITFDRYCKTCQGSKEGIWSFSLDRAVHPLLRISDVVVTLKLAKVSTV